MRGGEGRRPWTKRSHVNCNNCFEGEGYSVDEAHQLSYEYMVGHPEWVDDTMEGMRIFAAKHRKRQQ